MEISKSEGLIGLILIGIFLLTWWEINSDPSLSDILFKGSLAVIGFITGFYKLILERAVHDSIGKIIKNKLDGKMPEIKKNISRLEQELENLNFEEIEKLTLLLSNEFLEFKDLVGRYRIVQKVSLGLIFSLFSLLFFLINPSRSEPVFTLADGTPIYFNGIGYFFLLLGFWFAIHLVIIWYEILEKVIQKQ